MLYKSVIMITIASASLLRMQALAYLVGAGAKEEALLLFASMPGKQRGTIWLLAQTPAKFGLGFKKEEEDKMAALKASGGGVIIDETYMKTIGTLPAFNAAIKKGTQEGLQEAYVILMTDENAANYKALVAAYGREKADFLLKNFVGQLKPK